MTWSFNWDLFWIDNYFIKRNLELNLLNDYFIYVIIILNLLNARTFTAMNKNSVATNCYSIFQPLWSMINDIESKPFVFFKNISVIKENFFLIVDSSKHKYKLVLNRHKCRQLSLLRQLSFNFKSLPTFI